MSLQSEDRSNKLIHEKSPYLLQHAYNPVNWYPWGEEAFNKANEEDKPIFLSIGYSTCHWCHVMEKESFEDSTVATLMNETFISIKVDREERPDIDNVYMTVCRMMTGGGGWPLTIVMTPDKKPFFSGTYFPKESKFGRIGMIDLVANIRDTWDNKKDQVYDSAEKITDYLIENTGLNAGGEIAKSVFDRAYKEFLQRFDRDNGGFGRAPKFPTPHNLMFLLRYHKRTGNPEALEMVEKTLKGIRMGGVFDHIGFGFHRYSTDQNWFVPHFEKMLYDQALLVLAYAETFQLTKNNEYEKTAREILQYLLRDMNSPSGGFFSAEDADSEGEEGKFYTWSASEIREVLNTKDAEFISVVFNLTEEGNYYEEASKQNTGVNIFHLKESYEEIAGKLGYSPRDLELNLKRIRNILFEIREKRVHPLKDDKILTDWNGLTIAALAKAGRIFGDKEYIDSAEEAANFILSQMTGEDYSLFHRFRDGERALVANLDDYSFLIMGLLELYESRFKLKYLTAAREYNNYLIKHFWDDNQGGFYFTPDFGEKVLTRLKEIYDGAIPSGNSVAMLNLLKLAKYFSDSDLEVKAGKIADIFSDNVNNSPSNFTYFLTAMDYAFGPSLEVIIYGDQESNETKIVLDSLNGEFYPNKIVMLLTDENREEMVEMAEFTRNYNKMDGKTTIYICKNYVCNLPVTEADKMLSLIRSKINQE